jgi:hypothetical protein
MSVVILIGGKESSRTKNPVVMTPNLFYGPVAILGNVTSGWNAIVNLPKAEQEAMPHILHRLVEIMCNVVMTCLATFYYTRLTMTSCTKSPAE